MQAIAQAFHLGQRRAKGLFALPTTEQTREGAGREVQALENLGRPLPRATRHSEAHDPDNPLRH